MDAFEHKGYWWLPDHEEKKYPGTLSFSYDEGLRLEIFGLFSLELQAKYPIIKGKTLEGKHFTVFDCVSRRSTIVEPPDYIQEELSGEYAFESVVVGLGKTPPDSYSFHKAFVQYTYLPDWVGHSGLRRTYMPNETTGRVNRIEMTYQIPEKVTADLRDSRISIAERYDIDKKDPFVEGFGLRLVFEFEIEAEHETTFEDLREKVVGPLGDFLTFATGQPNAVVKLTLQSKLTDTDSSSDSSKFLSTTAYYPQITARVPRKAAVLRDKDMLFGFQDIKDEYPQIIQNWITSRKKFANSMMLFFAIKNSGEMYLEHKFLSLVQALEIYHRERFSNEVSPEMLQGHMAKINAVVDATPEKYREWLDNQLRLDRQVRLNQRILELLEHSESVISQLVKDIEIFARKITKTRNFLTHYSGKSGSVMEEIELYRATQVLSYIFQTCIMLELGLSEEKIVSLFERNENFKSTRRHIEQARDWQ